ncbi:MAG: hypothetical protein ACTSSE_11260 [Candidatus Thorarchaeota archaeon]
MPEVRAPDREVSFREKVVWTAVVLIIFLIMSHMPLYGVDRTVGTDYLWAMRVILASTRGTLMELGIGPIVTAGLVMQLLSGSKIIDVDFGDPSRGSCTLHWWSESHCTVHDWFPSNCLHWWPSLR